MPLTQHLTSPVSLPTQSINPTMLYSSDIFLAIQLSPNNIVWWAIIIFGISTYLGKTQSAIRSLLKYDADQRRKDLETQYERQGTVDRKTQKAENEFYTAVTFLSYILILVVSYLNLRTNYKDSKHNDPIDYESALHGLTYRAQILLAICALCWVSYWYLVKNPIFGWNKKTGSN